MWSEEFAPAAPSTDPGLDETMQALGRDATRVRSRLGYRLSAIAQMLQVGRQCFGHPLLDFLAAGAEREDTFDVGGVRTHPPSSVSS
jgi:hypothetical protein